jgi:large subunit ribosomal protein L21
VYAIFSDKERQFLVREGDTILVDRKDMQPGDEIKFDQVLCVDGKSGTPFIEGAAVSGVVRGGVKGAKIFVQKFKRRKKYRRRVGHRQKYTSVEITGIVS